MTYLEPGVTLGNQPLFKNVVMISDSKTPDSTTVRPFLLLNSNLVEEKSYKDYS